MDIKVNSVGFQGKKDHLYGLGKAAENVQLYSISKQSDLQKAKENSNTKAYEAAAKAYLDMLTRDYTFWNYVYSGFRPIDMAMVKNCLKPIKEIGVEPLDYFKKFIKEVMDNNSEKSRLDVAKRQRLFELIG